jgi:hypothetical protein
MNLAPNLNATIDLEYQLLVNIWLWDLKHHSEKILGLHSPTEFPAGAAARQLPKFGWISLSQLPGEMVLSQNLICYWIVWWRFPKSREYHQIIQSLDHDLVLKQPCWLGDPPFSETTILNPHWTVLFNGSSPPVKWSPFHQHPSRWCPNVQIVHDHPIRRNPADGDRWEVMACPAGAAPKVPILRWEEYQPNIFNNNVGPQVMFVGL